MACQHGFKSRRPAGKSQPASEKMGNGGYTGPSFPAPGGPAFDFDLIVNAETGIFPAEELFDQLLADPFLAEQEL